MNSNLPLSHYPVRNKFPELHEVEDKFLRTEIELGVEYERSTITIPLYLEGFPQPVETLIFTAYMRLRRETPSIYDISDPSLNSPITRRQFRFKIEIWEVVGGKSSLLGGDVAIALAEEIEGLRTASLGREEVEDHLKKVSENKLALREVAKGIDRLPEADLDHPDLHSDAEKLKELRDHEDRVAPLEAERDALALKLNELRHEANRQPWSLCHADQMGHDFPASIFYNAYFDVWVRPQLSGRPLPEVASSSEDTAGEYAAAIRKLSEKTPEPVKLVHTQPGVAIATNVQGIPPRNVVVTFHKPMVVEVPLTETTRKILFGDGYCTGMQTVGSKQEFLDGVNQARALRGAALLTIDQV